MSPILATSNEIKNLGFVVTDKVKLLGMEVDRNLNTLTSHFDEVSGKISRMIEYWDRFNLSLPGRISICKTFMLSQIGYLGCIISPNDEQLKRLQALTNDYCLGSIRIAKKCLYLPTCEGGLGLINLQNYIYYLTSMYLGETGLATLGGQLEI
jgi:hypothetical protein